MKIAIRPETVRFGRIIQRGRSWVFVKTDTNAEIRLYWSQLRSVQTELGGIVFSTGQRRHPRKGDKVVYVPLTVDGGWLWGFYDEYDRVLPRAFA